MKNPITLFYLPFNKGMLKEMSPYIKKGDAVLDFGCGRGTLSFLIDRELGAKTLGIDVRDGRDYQIPFQKFDGLKIPFPDNQFDVVLASYVLHHTPDVRKLLAEIKRVCRKYIIIYEDTPVNSFQRMFCGFHGSIFNGFFKTGSAHHFFSIKEWHEIFHEQSLQLVEEKNIGVFNPFYITRRTLFVLEKQA
jgi:SAM-dependent methyltransferase